MPENASEASLSWVISGESAAESEERIFSETVMEPEQLRATEDELRQACEALEESARAVSASERRVAQLQKAWEEAIAADDCSGASVEEGQSPVHARSPREAQTEVARILEEPRLDEYPGSVPTDADGCSRLGCNVEYEHQKASEDLHPDEHAEGSDDTAQLFVDVLQMAQELPARWQDMSAEERLRLIGDFSRVRGLLKPHCQQE